MMKKNLMSRKEKEKAARRRFMLEAAAELFAEKGYLNVSMHEIAKRSEYAVGTLYKFFKNKEDLYSALLREKISEIYGTLKNILHHKDDIKITIQSYIKEKIRLMKAHDTVYRMALLETCNAGFHPRSGLADELRRCYDELIDALTNVMKEGIRCRIFRCMDPKEMAIALDNLVNSILFDNSSEIRHQDCEMSASTILDIFLKGVHQYPVVQV